MSETRKKRKRESQSTVADYTSAGGVDVDDPVKDTLRQYQEDLESSFPVKRLRDFYDTEKIKEFALKQRDKTYKEFLSKVSRFTGNTFADMWRDLENSIQKIMEVILRRNEVFRKEFEVFLQKTICIEYQKSVEMYLSTTKGASINEESLQKVLEERKAEALNSFLIHMKREPRSEEMTRLEEQLNQTREKILESRRQQQRLEGTSSETPLKIEDNPVSNAILKFRETLESKFPFKGLRDFYEDEKITEEAKKERANTHMKFVSKVSMFTSDELGEMWKDLDKGIQKAAEEFLKKNNYFREETRNFVLGNICEEFERIIDLQMNECLGIPPMTLAALVDAEIFEAKKQFLPNCNCTLVWDCSCLSQRLRGKMARIRVRLSEMARQSVTKKRKIQRPSSTVTSTQPIPKTVKIPSTSISLPQFQNFVELERWILEKFHKFKSTLAPNFGGYFGMSMNKAPMQNLVREFIITLENNKHLSSDSDIDHHRKFLEVVTIANEVISHAFPIGLHDSILRDGHAAWICALHIDLIECLPSHRENREAIRKYKWRIAWILNLAYVLGKGTSRIIPQVWPEHIQKEIDSVKEETEKIIASAASTEEGNRNPGPQPEMLLVRLRRVWDAEKKASMAKELEQRKNSSCEATQKAQKKSK